MEIFLVAVVSGCSDCLFDSRVSLSREGVLGMAPESLPVGFRFHPTDEELINHYLKLKILGMDSQVDIIPEVDICKWEPWDLPVLSLIQPDESEWFFFSRLNYKYQTGRRCNRSTQAGFWKPTGNDRKIKSRANKELIGTKQTLVFYTGRTPQSVKTNWIMHEYRAAIASIPNNMAYVLCRLFRKPDGRAGPDIPPEPISNSGEIDLDLLAELEPFAGELSYQASNIVSDFGNYQVEELIQEEDPEIQGLSNETTFILPDYDFFSDTEQGPYLDPPFAGGCFNNFCGSTLFQEDSSGPDDDVSRFLNTLIVDQDEHPFGELSSQRSSAVANGNPGHGFIGKLSARPQSPLRGVYGKGDGSSSDTDSEVIQVQQYRQFRQASSLTGQLVGTKECTQSSIARRQYAASQSSSINQHRRENKSSLHGESWVFASPFERSVNFVVEGAPKGVKLEGNASNADILQASTKLSSSMSKPKEKPVSTKAKKGTEHVSVTDLLHKKDSIKESKRYSKVSLKDKVKPSPKSIWNGPVGSNQKGCINSPGSAAVRHEQSSSPDYLVNLLVGLVLFVIVIAVMVLDIKGFKTFAMR